LAPLRAGAGGRKKPLTVSATLRFGISGEETTTKRTSLEERRKLKEKTHLLR